MSNIVSLPGRDIRWNGVAIDEQKLAAYLRETAEMNPRPFVIFDPLAANCRFASEVRAVIDHNYPCQEGACGQGSRSSFEEEQSKTS